MEIQRYWSVVRKRLWLIALLAIIGCTSVGYYTSHHVRPDYQAVTKLMVYQKEASSDAPSVLDPGAINSSIQLIKTYKQLILTPRVLNQVAAQYPELRTTAGEIAAKLGISSVSETQIMTVIVSDESYPRAARMANAVSKVFQEQVRELMNLDNVSVIDWADPSETRQPPSPPTVKNVAIVFVLMTMIGIGLAFLLEHLDDSVKSERDVRERLDMPLLADVPRIERRDLRSRDNRSHTTMTPRRNPNVTLDA